MSAESRIAAGIVEEALGRIFDPAAVVGLRPDSPLAGLGMVPGDAIAIADAIRAASSQRGYDCELGDADLSDVPTVDHLIRAVADRAMPVGNQ